MRKLRSLLSFGIKGYLAEIGWFVAFEKKASVDINNKPIPWFTYSCIDFLQNRIQNSCQILEYGSGNSTRYFATKGAEIISIEHDRTWYETGIKNKPTNATLIYCMLDYDGQYCRSALNHNKQFDIIIIDGRDRVNCCKQSIQTLSDRGIILLDDSEREKYKDARNLLIEKGFKEIMFTGVSPGFFYKKATSIFYRPGNCLDI